MTRLWNDWHLLVRPNGPETYFGCRRDKRLSLDGEQFKSTFCTSRIGLAGADGFWNCWLDTNVFGSLISILDRVKFNDTVGKRPRGEASHACHFLRR